MQSNPNRLIKATMSITIASVSMERSKTLNLFLLDCLIYQESSLLRNLELSMRKAVFE